MISAEYAPLTARCTHSEGGVWRCAAPARFIVQVGRDVAMVCPGCLALLCDAALEDDDQVARVARLGETRLVRYG